MNIKLILSIPRSYSKLTTWHNLYPYAPIPSQNPNIFVDVVASRTLPCKGSKHTSHWRIILSNQRNPTLYSFSTFSQSDNQLSKEFDWIYMISLSWTYCSLFSKQHDYHLLFLTYKVLGGVLDFYYFPGTKPLDVID